MSGQLLNMQEEVIWCDACVYDCFNTTTCIMATPVVAMSVRCAMFCHCRQNIIEHSA